MIVRVQLFSHLRDAAGAAEVEITLRENATAAELLEQLYSRTPALRAWDKSVLIGAGVEFVGRDYQLAPNEAIAVMPPVQGG